MNTVLLHSLTSIDPSDTESVGIVCLLSSSLDVCEVSMSIYIGPKPWFVFTAIILMGCHFSILTMLFEVIGGFLSSILTSAPSVIIFMKEHSSCQHPISLVSDDFMIGTGVAILTVINMMLIISYHW